MLDAMRDLRVRRIRFLVTRYGLDWLVDQAIIEAGSIEQLSPSALLALHADLERARECLADGVAFEDAGLVRRCG